MKANYKNWMPRGLVATFFAVSGLFLFLFVLFLCSPILPAGSFLKTLACVITGGFALLFLLFGSWAFFARRAFSYDGRRRLSRDVIEGIAQFIAPKDGENALDVGCGSGALAIAVARKNKNAHVTGLDYWGKNYASYSKALCEQNAAAEHVQNVHFLQGDARKLPFPDESMDIIVSNYVYHNIPSADRQALLKESLRVLKKGGVFALHDLFTRQRYGDMESFLKELKAQGFTRTELIDTTNGLFMQKHEARLLLLKGSRLLYGVK